MSSLPVSYLHRLRSGSDDVATLATRGCLNPREIQVVDSATTAPRLMYTDCGKCFNCVNDRRNQWVTRMCLHSLYWKHCYFVTLTYGSYNLTHFKAHPFLQDWIDTRPVCNSDNSLKRTVWRPTILCRSHLEKFMKRLRFNTGAEISSVYCGEYGEKYCRPHFHLILWSKRPLTQIDFNRAWSYKCVKTGDPRIIRKFTGNTDYFYFRIGTVKIYDLVANGTLDWDTIKPVESDKSAHFCFQYVAKYVGKSDCANSKVYKYIRRAWDLTPFLDSDADKDTLEYFLETKAKNISLNSHLYEKIYYSDFDRMVQPFFGCSRLYSIGKQYYLENRDRFASANFSLPKFCGRDLVFPRYFHSLLEIERQPFRLSKIVLSGYSFVKGRYPDLLAYFQKFAVDKNYIFDLYYDQKKTTPCWFGDRLVTDYTCISRNGDIMEVELLRSDGVPLHCRYSVVSDVFTVDIFNCHTRMYEFYEYIERVDFCKYVCSLLEKAISRFNKNKPLIDGHYQLDMFVKQPLVNIGNKIRSKQDLTDDEIKIYAELQRYIENVERRQLIYNQNHKTETQ